MLFIRNFNVITKFRSRIFHFQTSFLSTKQNNHQSNVHKCNSKETQFETAKMSQLKTIHLKDISKETFELFNIHVTDEIQFLNSIFKNNGLEMRMAGGGVRDLLCNIAPHDIDFATPATPDTMIKMLENIENLRLITTVSGFRHGTVTARLNNRVQYEITTLRIDKETDGRHAEVEFVNDWKIDASRRDLTINSMFIDLNGVLYDYFNGREDLENKRIRFVGDVSKRIKEDYLRIFRYFRFHARFGIPGVHDPGTIQKISENLLGLKIISGERIWTELKRILSNKNCVNSIEVLFQQLETAPLLGFHRNKLNLERFYLTLQNLEKFSEYPLKRSWLPNVLFASLIENTEELTSVSNRLKFSNVERASMTYIILNRDCSSDVSEQTMKTQLALSPKPEQVNLRDHILQYLYSIGANIDLIHSIQNWPIPDFPLKGNILSGRVNRKQQIAQLITELKYLWAQSDFQMSEDELQVKVGEILERMKQSKS